MLSSTAWGRKSLMSAAGGFRYPSVVMQLVLVIHCPTARVLMYFIIPDLERFL